MPELTIESAAYKKIMEKLTFLEQSIKAMSATGQSRWLTESETMALTGLGKRSLLNKRKKGEFGFSSATGRKIKYLRKDVENYLNHNSTLQQ